MKQFLIAALVGIASLTAYGDARLGQQYRVISASSGYPIGKYDDIVNVSALSASASVSLFDAAANAGKTVTVVKTDSSANTVTITPLGAQLINGASSYKLTLQNQSVEMFSNGSNWIVRSGNAPWAVNSGAAIRVEYASISPSGAGASCTITSSSSNWLTASGNAAGDCTVTISGFSSAPICTASANQTSSTILQAVQVSHPSSTTVRLVDTYISTGPTSPGLTGNVIDLICTGPR